MTIDLDKVEEILTRAKAAAIDYYQLTAKPLGITGEIGEYLARGCSDRNSPTHEAQAMMRSDDRRVTRCA